MTGRKRFKRVAFNLPQRSRILVVSEGEVTEREYLYSALRGRRYSGSEFIFLGPGPTSPREIVKRAKQVRIDSRRERFDAVWCIFDVEAEVDQKFRTGLLDAIQEAASSDVSLAISNPCFELWVAIHLGPITAPTTSHTVQTRCEQLNLERQKHLVDGDGLVLLFERAKQNAVNLRAQHLRNNLTRWQDMNPCTTVDCLIDDIYRLFPKR